VQALPGAVLDDPRIGWWLITPRTGSIGMGEAASAFRDWLAQTAAEDSLDCTH
jgi:LysR family glycine cleavage system transcriptional activator